MILFKNLFIFNLIIFLKYLTGYLQECLKEANEKWLGVDIYTGKIHISSFKINKILKN